MKLYLRFLNSLLIVYLLLSFIGCATAPYNPPMVQQPPGVPGFYHRVEQGQTLWMISKMYNVDLDELVRINRIQDAAILEQGQQVFVPGTKKAVSEATKYPSEDFIWPVHGRIIAYFGQTYNNMINKGINIQPASSSDVLCSRSGKVIFYADNFGSFGKIIIIEHGEGFSTVYARNSAVFVKAGDVVEKGTVIAKVGSAGRDKNRYLHFEIRKGHIPQNPNYYLP